MSLKPTFKRSREDDAGSLFPLWCCSVCGRWWATRGACGHLRCETTSSSAAPRIAPSRSGMQRRENVSTPSTGIPQQCAACTYMRKGMNQSCYWVTLSSCESLKSNSFPRLWHCAGSYVTKIWWKLQTIKDQVKKINIKTKVLFSSPVKACNVILKRFSLKQTFTIG